MSRRNRHTVYWGLIPLDWWAMNGRNVTITEVLPKEQRVQAYKGLSLWSYTRKTRPRTSGFENQGLMLNVPVNFRALRILKDTVSCASPCIVFPRVTADVPKPFVLSHCFFNSIYFQAGCFEMRHKMWSWKIFFPCFKSKLVFTWIKAEMLSLLDKNLKNNQRDTKRFYDCSMLSGHSYIRQCKSVYIKLIFF